ncbi:MAG: 30S ribosomal protein S1 [Desulfobacula sp.]|uniref:30S ribosomal protein S1 n=1 Tax=Desulfobacula sp. TaxID=2593537 RepID=UPI0025B8A42F|nr:30S ribosomal protein S1 [Desulfobacula sp.]MCD4721427.1 30S ribosomal protein S1 [Desulfobacula sp.]
MTDPIDDKADDNTNDNKGENTEEMSFAELFESYDTKIGHELNQGDMVEGEIISIGSNSVYIDTGTKSDGVVGKSELLDENGEFVYKAGDKVRLYVVSLSESEIILSKALSGAGKATMLNDASQNGTPVEGKVIGVIKGGFNVDIMGKRAFCPVSQIDVKYVENQEDYVGQTHHFLITRFEEGGRNIVVSRRDLLNEEIKEKLKVFLEKVEEGDIVQGTVTKLMPYGAFIELIPGVEGMAHISELSWSRIEKAEEVIQPGDVVNVKLLKIESAKESDTIKISLSMKQTSSNPWDSMGDGMGSAFNVGDQVSGRVVRLASFGAFVEIAPGVDGLVHISEMSHTRRVLRPDDVVQVGDNTQVVIKSIDMDSKRISLSIKDALGDPWTGASVRYEVNSIVEGRLEKREKFGLFINLEPGVTGLMPSSKISGAANPSVFEKLKPGSSVQVMIQEVDEDKRRITLTSPDQKEGDNWKLFAGNAKSKSLGTMENLFLEAMKKKK